jgi:hypothetical protein
MAQVCDQPYIPLTEYCLKGIFFMTWNVVLAVEFEAEFERLAEVVQDELLAHMQLLERFGPALGWPHADTLNCSRHANMKELRFKAGGGVWRVAFAFDPRRNAIVLVAGSKSGYSKRWFYRRLVNSADRRFDRHLAAFAGESEHG